MVFMNKLRKIAVTDLINLFPDIIEGAKIFKENGLVIRSDKEQMAAHIPLSYSVNLKSSRRSTFIIPSSKGILSSDTDDPVSVRGLYSLALEHHQDM